MSIFHVRSATLLLAGTCAFGVAAVALAASSAPAPATLPTINPSGPTILETYKKHFLIGTAGDIPDNFPDAELALIKHNFNILTNDNLLKMNTLHPQADTWNFTRADKLVEWCTTNGVAVHGHTLVWGQTPAWFFDGKDKETITKRMKDHITTVVTRYKGKIHGWDVINDGLNDTAGPNGTESLRSHGWLQNVGPEYMTLAFKFAHEADPQARLYYNEAGIEKGSKHENAMALFRRLLKEGAPINGVGIQGHWATNNLPLEDLEKSIVDFNSLGLKVAISELDIGIPAAGGAGRGRGAAATPPTADALTQQADAYAKLFALLLKHKDKIERVTFWGYTDSRTFRNGQSPLIFDAQLQRKPAYNAIVEAARP